MPDALLTDVEAVKAVHRTVGSGSEYDELIQRYILAASREINRWAQREFAPKTEDEARTFHIREGGYLSLAPFDLRALTAITEGAGPALTTYEADHYQLHPQPTPDGVWGWISFAYHASDFGARARRLTITGDWGFPAVPWDVEEACIATVAEWLSASQAGEGPGPELFEGGGTPNRALPSKARYLLAPYRRMEIG